MANRIVKYFRRHRNRWKLEVIIAAAVLAVIAVVCLLPDPMGELVEEIEERFVNEGCAAVHLHLIHAAEDMYREEWGVYCNWEKAVRPEIAKATSPENAADGYYYRFMLHEGWWSCVAIPAEPGVSGTRSYYIDQAGDIRMEPCGKPSDPPAGADSPLFDS